MASWNALGAFCLAAALAGGAVAAEPPRKPRSPYALTDDEIDRIPPPSIPRPKSWMVRKVREAAKAGDLERVKSLTYDPDHPQPMDNFENYRNDVVDMMRRKAAAAKQPQPSR